MMSSSVSDRTNLEAMKAKKVVRVMGNGSSKGQRRESKRWVDRREQEEDKKRLESKNHQRQQEVRRVNTGS